MKKTYLKPLMIGVLALGLVLPVRAQTVADLQAQLNALLAQLSALQGGQGSGVVNAISSDLTVGSSGNSVVVLQNALIAQGYLTMPAGVAKGYFGQLTRAAVQKWQAANGVPSTGYFGPLSRGKFNASAGVGGTVPGTTVPGSISTSGVEGTLTVTLAPSPGAGETVHEGDNREPVLGMEIEADLSDIRIERIKLELEATTGGSGDRDFYQDIADRLYIMDGSTVLASVDLNSNTVIEETSGEYFVTITGVNYIVRKDTEKTLTVAIDAQESFDSDFEGDTWTVQLANEGVRGVDGAGVNQYSPATGSTVSRTFTTQGSEAEDATLTISNNVSTPQANEVIADEGTDEDELDGLELLRFDVEAEDDDVTITDLVVDMTRTGSTATTTTGYLYHGSTLLASDSIDTDGHSGFTFEDIDFTVSEDDTETLMVKVDVTDATTAATLFTADIDTADVTAENSDGDDITESGSATGEAITVRKVGIQVSLVSKSITKGSTPSQNNQSTSTVEATFVLRVTAVGGDIILGTAGSTTVPFVSNAGGSHDDNPSFDIWVGGSATVPSVASSTSLTVPSGVVNETNNSFTIQEGNTVDIPVSFAFEGRTTAGALLSLGSYAVGIQQLNWVSSAGIQESNFMDNESAWRTSTVTLP